MAGTENFKSRELRFPLIRYSFFESMTVSDDSLCRLSNAIHYMKTAAGKSLQKNAPGFILVERL